jgi:hypothetical protein
MSTLPPELLKELADFLVYLQAKQSARVKPKARKFGCAKGAFVMASDFDAPLDDFKDYM